MKKKNLKPNFVFPDQELVDNYKEIARDFFIKILDMEENKVLYTDESLLSDFTGAGTSIKPVFPPVIFKGRLLNDGDDTKTLSEKLKKAKEEASKKPEFQQQKDSYSQYCKEWDSQMKQSILGEYGVEIDNTRILLHELFEKIKNQTLNNKPTQKPKNKLH